jgi:ubiquitin-like 1-activating enzyme E1 B
MENSTILLIIRLLYDVEFDDNLESSLKSLDVKNGSQLTVTNDDDEPENNFSVVLFISPWY